MPSYNTLKSKLELLIQEFLDGKGIGRYIDEAHMRSALAGRIKAYGFDVDEDIDVEMPTGGHLRPDIVVYLGKKTIPIELKYNNTSLDEYIEDEEKCERYVDEFYDVFDAYYIFVSNIAHRDYRCDEWNDCVGNSKYHFIWNNICKA